MLFWEEEKESQVLYGSVYTRFGGEQKRKGGAVSVVSTVTEYSICTSISLLLPTVPTHILQHGAGWSEKILYGPRPATVYFSSLWRLGFCCLL